MSIKNIDLLAALANAANAANAANGSGRTDYTADTLPSALPEPEDYGQTFDEYDYEARYGHFPPHKW